MQEEEFFLFTESVRLLGKNMLALRIKGEYYSKIRFKTAPDRPEEQGIGFQGTQQEKDRIGDG